MLIVEGMKAYWTAAGRKPGNLEALWDYEKGIGRCVQPAVVVSDRYCWWSFGTVDSAKYEKYDYQYDRQYDRQLPLVIFGHLWSVQRVLDPWVQAFAMASQEATLQNYNNELVKSIEDLREKREELNRQILKEEEDKAKIQKELSILTDRLQKVNESLVRKTQARNEYDKTIQETEAAYMKILESSQTLLHVLKRETVNLTKKKQGSD
ncbi:unnamed protein product [Cladocopium goreaui]|uniref:Microtubule nucleation factor SSNA1 (CrSSNA1) (13 kDa deflagellation-inducible protein) n=1 Tax=Cladocopium goreaui TaxID=2562237 RepID=A0A9P1DRX6_9DINO|nr:unnamed protein product [Cladocopium goreaui]